MPGADIFDKQKIEIPQLPSRERIPYHRCVEMADRAGNDLLHHGSGAGEARGIVVRSQITD